MDVYRDLYRAIGAHLEGDEHTVNALAARIELTPIYLQPFTQLHLCVLTGDINAALDLFARLIDESEYMTMHNARLGFPTLPPKYFSKFYNDPRYSQILEDAGLDDESVARLVVPPLPF